MQAKLQKVAHVFTARAAAITGIIWLYSASYRSAPEVFVKRIISADWGTVPLNAATV